MAAYDEMVSYHARRLDGAGGAEFDDLRQEGLIATWEALRDGYHVNSAIVRNGMLNWVDKCRRRGFGNSVELTDTRASS